MSFDDEDVDVGFKAGTDDEDELGEPLDAPEGMLDFGLDDEDPDRDGQIKNKKTLSRYAFYKAIYPCQACGANCSATRLRKAF